MGSHLNDQSDDQLPEVDNDWCDWTGERRIVTVEFEYDGCDSNDKWVESRLQKAFTAIKDVRVVAVRPAEEITVSIVERAGSIYDTLFDS